MKNIFKTIQDNVNTMKARSAWGRAVIVYAQELLEDLESNPSLIEEFNEGMPIREKDLLSGAINWEDYSEGGCSLIYNEEIAERLCTPSELEKTNFGKRHPNKQEDWIECQTRALKQASDLIINLNRK